MNRSKVDIKKEAFLVELNQFWFNWAYWQKNQAYLFLKFAFFWSLASKEIEDPQLKDW